MLTRSRRTGGDERGATAVEYALVVGFIAAVIAATVALIGPDLIPLYDWATPYLS